MVKDCQVKCLFRIYGQTGFIGHSAMKSGMDRKTATKYLQKKKLPSSFSRIRGWRTREDPLVKIWEEAEEFLSDAPELEAKALFEHLLEKHPNQLNQAHLRTFQRRVRSWHVLKGKKKEVFFDQTIKPGECMQLDWTDMNALNIIIAGKHYLHKLAHIVLPYSNHEGAVRCRSESILSIKKVLRHFLYAIKATPATLQVDNSSAATHQIKKTEAGRGFNDDLVSIAAYYGFFLRSTNINCPNENGDVESLNGHIKNRIKQALLLRKSTSFDSMEDYDQFLQTVFDKANKPRMNKLLEELQVMNVIPENPLPEYQETYVSVRSGSTVHIKKVTYSVPSRLIGSELKARIYENIIVLYNGRDLVHEMPRMLGDRGQVIDYRHIIHSLVRKPGAFKNYRYRGEMYPTDIFRIVFDKLISVHGERKGCLEYLRILKLAAETMESDVESALFLLLEKTDVNFSSKEVEALVNSQNFPISAMAELVPDLTSYDALIKGDDDDVVCTNKSSFAQGTQALGHEHVLSGSDCQSPECQLVPREDIATFVGNRDRSSKGEKNRESDQAIRSSATVYPGDAESKISDTEASQGATNLVGGEFRYQSRECTGIRLTG